jgi:hypothetical protein
MMKWILAIGIAVLFFCPRLELPLLEALLLGPMSGDLPRPTDPDLRSPQPQPRRAGLWLRPRALPGLCDREPCHGKMVQDRIERLSILLDAIAATETRRLVRSQ